MHEMMRFDLAVVEVPIKIGNNDYILREASEDAVCKYRNALLKSTKLGPEGKPSAIDGMADVEPLLVSFCLFEKYDHKGVQKERNVSLQTIRSWPSRIVTQLFDKAKEISEIEEKETPEELEKQIASLQEKLEQAKAKDDPSKNEQKTTSGT